MFPITNKTDKNIFEHNVLPFKSLLIVWADDIINSHSKWKQFQNVIVASCRIYKSSFVSNVIWVVLFI